MVHPEPPTVPFGAVTEPPTEPIGAVAVRHRRLENVFEAACDATPHAIALDCHGIELTYAELDARANRLAHHLGSLDIGVGDRCGILLDRSVDTYVALLGVLKSGAAFVPIDPAAPADRVEYIATDSGAGLVVTQSRFGDLLDEIGVRRFEMDSQADVLAAYPARRPHLWDAARHEDPAAYILYTSGSTGRPKGVEVAQSSICNFLSIVPVLYDVRPTDRVYQGMIISFDFSIEEIWPTWAHGATLVAGPTGAGRLGGELADFLDDRQVTVLYCVPTLLATIPRDLPLLRAIMVGGEACPRELVERWGGAGRRILNTYGPTETTVTCTWGELVPGKPVTIGVPLPTYEAVILDDLLRVVPDGEVGELCIGGPGVARGYVNRPDLTAERFLEVPGSGIDGRIYRTGDLARWTANGEIEYLGRADTEVKIRGHRVDLGEIESVLLVDDEVASAVVSLVTIGGVEQLASWVVLMPGLTPTADGVAALVRRLHETTGSRLPYYMVPTFVDVLDELPMMPSGKVDRKRLPAPTGRRLTAAADGPIVAPATAAESTLRDLCAGVLGISAASISVEGDFFTDLGGHSLAAAQLVTRLRETGLAAGAGIRDVYAHPTIRELAAAFTAPTEEPVRPATTRPADASPFRFVATDGQVRRAGVVQGLFLLVVLLVVTLPVSIVYSHHDGQPSYAALVDLLVATVPTYFGVRWLLPVLLVRPLSAGITPGRYRLWRSTYLRLWMIEHLMMLAPLPVLSGSPLMATFLRAVGARVGRGTHIGTSTVPFPAFVSIADDASVGYNTDLRPWIVEGSEVIVGRIAIGARAFVASNCVVGPDSVIGDGAMLGEQAVVDGQALPVATRWAGAPARPVARLDDRVETMAAAGPAPRWTTGLLLLAALGVVGLEAAAVATIVPALVLVWWVLLGYGMLPALAATLVSGAVYVATVCLIVAGGKKLLLPRLPIGTHHEASGLGIRKWATDKLLEMSLLYTNSLYATLYTAPWLRLLGARIGNRAEVSTVSHIDPDLLTIERESFVADMASLGGTTFCNGRMTFARTRVGTRAFIGNAAVLPAGMATGDGSLVGVLTVPPASGVPADSSWVGNPAFRLPVRQDSGDFDDAATFDPPARLVAHRYWIELFRIVLPATIIGVSLYFYLLALSLAARGWSLGATIAAAPFIALGTAVCVVLFAAGVKNNLIGAYRPRVEPLWSVFVRRAEFATGIYEAAAVPVLVQQLTGTPYLPMVLRWFGVRVGRRVWLATTYLTEFDLVTIGDDAAVGTGVSLQTHLFEDRVMKMSTVTVGDRATVGTRAIVLYDAVVADDAALGSLSLLMKGDELPAGTRWHGIPAQAVR